MRRYDVILENKRKDGDDKPWGPGSHLYEHVTTQHFPKTFLLYLKKFVPFVLRSAFSLRAHRLDILFSVYLNEFF